MLYSLDEEQKIRENHAQVADNTCTYACTCTCIPVLVPVPVVDPATLPCRSTCESYLWEEPTTSSSYSKQLDKVKDHPIGLNLELNTVLVEFPTQHRSISSSRSANQKTAITQNLCRIRSFLCRPKYKVLSFV